MFIDLEKLLDPRKILPFYVDRLNIPRTILGPLSIELHWTSNCNYNCIHCSYGSRRKSVGFLSKKLVDNLISDLSNFKTKAVYLSGGGEPTMLKLWEKYATQLLDANVEVALITNSVAINEKHLSIIRRLNYIAVSVYSTKEDHYQKITGRQYFKKQFSLPEIIRKEQTDTIVGARCVLNEINYKEIYEIYEKAMNSSFDYIIFIPAVDYEEKGVGLSSEKIDKIKEIIKSNSDQIDKNRTNLKTLLHRKVHHYEQLDYRSLLSKIPEGCKAIQMRSGSFVNFDGGVYLCQPDIGNRNYEIGNLNKQRFSEIWNKDRHLKIIDILNRRYNSGSCRDCRSIKLNQNIYNFESGKVKMPDWRDPFV